MIAFSFSQLLPDLILPTSLITQLYVLSLQMHTHMHVRIYTSKQKDQYDKKC